MKNNDLNVKQTVSLAIKHASGIHRSTRLFNNNLDKFFKADFAANPDQPFQRSLYMLNSLMNEFIAQAQKECKIEQPEHKESFVSKLVKASPTLAKNRKLLINLVQNRFNAISDLGDQAYSLKQVPAKSKPKGATNFPWSGQFELVIIQKGKRSASTNVATTKPTATAKEPSNATVAEVFAGKTKNQQIAALKQLAKHGDIKVPAQQVLDILYGLNAFVALDTVEEKQA